MRYAIVFCAALLLGCDEQDLLYGDGSEWQDVSLDPGRSIPKDLREWDRWAMGQVAIPARDVKTFTPTWTGFSVDPAGDMKYANLGEVAVVWPTTTLTLGTSNATTFVLNGLPDEIVPDAVQRVSGSVWLWDNGNVFEGVAQVSSLGNSIAFALKAVSGSNIAMGSLSGWTPAGNKGIDTGSFIIYPLH